VDARLLIREDDAVDLPGQGDELDPLGTAELGTIRRGVHLRRNDGVTAGKKLEVNPTVLGERHHEVALLVELQQAHALVAVHAQDRDGLRVALGTGVLLAHEGRSARTSGQPDRQEQAEEPSSKHPPIAALARALVDLHVKCSEIARRTSAMLGSVSAEEKEKAIRFYRRPWFRRALKVVAAAFALTVLAALSPWGRPHVLAVFLVDRVNLPRFATPARAYREVTFESHGTKLSGWLFEPEGTPRGLVVHLHARMYTRVGGIATADALVPRGYAVFAYDQRAHGASGGEHCTYGALEKHDLARAIDAIGISPVYVVGHSFGASVALQGAAADPRIRGVVSASCYSDLRAALTERAAEMPLVTPEQAASAIAIAERKAGFHVDDVSPFVAASHIEVPVLLVHGDRDTATPPRHSERLLTGLHVPKRLYIVEGANHTEVLDDPRAPVWAEIGGFFDGLAAESGSQNRDARAR
jgi:alpha-beta hydrolase superfamily lysophospholipase